MPASLKFQDSLINTLNEITNGKCFNARHSGIDKKHLGCGGPPGLVGAGSRRRYVVQRRVFAQFVV